MLLKTMEFYSRHIDTYTVPVKDTIGLLITDMGLRWFVPVLQQSLQRLSQQWHQ